MAKKAAAYTAEPDPLVTLEFNGQTYLFPRDQDRWPSRAIVAASHHQPIVVIEHVLGANQYEALLDSCDGGQLKEFIAAFSDAVIRECN